MPLKKQISFFVTQIFCCVACFAQTHTIDSLKEVLPSLKGEARIDCLNELSYQYIVVEWNSSEGLRLYLDLEKLRFENSFNYYIRFINDVELATVFIPPMLLQPFIENAFWHGLMHKQGEGFLDIALCIEGEILTCTITDNGIGRNKAAIINSKSAEKNKSMGMKITEDRLTLLSRNDNERALCKIEDLTDEAGNELGTKVILKMKYRSLVDTHEYQKQ